MILDLLNEINKLNIILGSTSPRRIEYLSKLGLEFKIEASKFEENLDKSLYKTPIDYCCDTSKHKTEEVFNRLKNDDMPSSILIGADSIVVKGQTIFEKPKSVDDAKQMLRQLSASTHQVCTSVTIIAYNSSTKIIVQRNFYVLTEVEFDEISDSLINHYIENCKPFDKAGSYGIQEVPASSFIKKINGDFYNVTGLPIHQLSKELREVYISCFNIK
ncbi:hypothetical protein DLAC_10415 [Tieghemostelium lacteum]|uniref:Maf family protein n=1 Tax=Tieghemostelium lacteum TaxID=361077 RepID=A0A151Z5C1_TIELA|nr:hypothetical protein DLAC_10415 [Tieghemostelium lacteum]|eukprot:KYQ89169.1 hypothetical protein DLAC_10415 [Tieghemostelium lacteum]